MHQSKSQTVEPVYKWEGKHSLWGSCHTTESQCIAIHLKNQVSVMRLCIGSNWPFSISAKDLCSVDFVRKDETSFWMETTRSLRNCKQKSQLCTRWQSMHFDIWKQLNTNSKVQGTQLFIYKVKSIIWYPASIRLFEGRFWCGFTPQLI